MSLPVLGRAHLARYKQIAGLLLAHGRGDLAEAAGLTLPAVLSRQDDEPEAERAARFARDLEDLGPTFVKLGQLLSTRPDLLPEAHLEALGRLQDDVRPVPVAEIEAILEAELGHGVGDLFQRFEERPLASASLAQVHRATLGNGHEVVVKVQRPGVRATVHTDLQVLGELVRLVSENTELGRTYRLDRVLEAFEEGLREELDFTREAQNMRALAHNMRSFERIVVPEPVDRLVTRRVLVSDFVRGRKLTRGGPLRWIELDARALVEELHRASLRQAFEDGLFHADPHPGNVLLTPEGALALLDAGAVVRLSPGVRARLLRFLLAVTERDGDRAAEAALDLSEPARSADPNEYRRRVSHLVMRHAADGDEDLHLGPLILGVTRIGGETGQLVPRELTLLARALISLEQVVYQLAPGFRVADGLRRFAARSLQAQVGPPGGVAAVVSGLLEAREMAEDVPRRLRRVLELAADNRLRVSVDAIDESFLVRSLLRVANRITTGLVLAALIVGAALLMRIETDFEVLGYPGLAILLFLAAAGMGLWLVASIVVGDLRARRRGAGRR